MSLVNIFGAVFLLGFLIFIHELGHFLAAKFVNVKVERFAIGFGPSLFKFQWGETEYTLCLLPLGGYVKMIGEDPNEEVSEENQDIDPERTFSGKKIWERALIVFGGPAVNLIFPFVAYLLFMNTSQSGFEARFLTIMEDSPAMKAGILEGDVVKEIDGQKIYAWKDMQKIISKAPGKEISIKVVRNGEEKLLTVTPSSEKGLTPYGKLESVGKIGVLNMGINSMIGISNPESAAYKAGLRSFDTVESFNGKEVKSFKDIEMLASGVVDGESLISIKVKRPPENWDGKDKKAGEIIELNLAAKEISKGLENAGIISPVNFAFSFAEDSKLAKILKKGDRIVAVNELPVKNLLNIEKILKKAGSDEVTLHFMRDGQKMESKYKVQRNLKYEKYIPGFKPIYLGIQLAPFFTTPEKLEYSIPFSEVPAKAVTEVLALYDIMFKSLEAIFSGSVSIRALGGPIMIFDVAAKAASNGLMQYLFLMALISINLGLINLLPVPVLDGGHLLYLGMEMIKGEPITGKFRQYADMTGMIMLLSLMAFTILNDIYRYIN